MASLLDTHRQAMHLCHLAIRHRDSGEVTASQGIFRQAFLLEQEVAISATTLSETAYAQTRLILPREVVCRSAAALALEAGLPAEALCWAKAGLEICTDSDIEGELHAVQAAAEFLLKSDNQAKGENLQ